MLAVTRGFFRVLFFSEKKQYLLNTLGDIDLNRINFCPPYQAQYPYMWMLKILLLKLVDE